MYKHKSRCNKNIESRKSRPVWTKIQILDKFVAECEFWYRTPFPRFSPRIQNYLTKEIIQEIKTKKILLIRLNRLIKRDAQLKCHIPIRLIR